MNILVTGGAGYIGSTVARQLIEAGHSVIIVDNLSRNDRQSIPPEARFIEADIAELDDIITPNDNIEAVMHFAAFIAAGESVREPELYWQNNTVKTLRLLASLPSNG